MTFRETEELPHETDGNIIIDIEEGLQLKEEWVNLILSLDDNVRDNVVNKNIQVTKETDLENLDDILIEK